MSIQILGTGAYVPEHVVTNDDLSKMVDTSDEWITQRVGVKERRISVDESVTDMAVKSSERAMQAAGITAADLDLIIVATVSADTMCPSAGAMLQKRIGATCPAFEINSACSGFMYALDTAAAFIARGGYNKVLVVGSERISRILDWTDRSTCVIFGDGSGAVVAGPGEQYLTSKLATTGNEEALSIPAGQGNSPFYKKKVGDYRVVMAGQDTFKFAVRRLEEDIRDLCSRINITPDQLNWVVPHQANIRIIDLCARRLGIPMEKFHMNIEKYGNTSSASVPIAFDELVRSGKLKKGDLIALCAFGGGLSSGSCILRW